MTSKVFKRSGAPQPLDLDKIHAVLEWAVNGDSKNGLKPIKGTSVSMIEMKARLELYDGIHTSNIHKALIKAASSLISSETPNYDKVAARLVWFSARKEAFGENIPPHLFDVVIKNIALGLYHFEILSMYSKEEWDIINGFIDHNRDDLFHYAGAQQMVSKYLAQNRKTKQIYESFQFPYILVAAVLFANYPKETRLGYVKDYYDMISIHDASEPTPIMAGLRTKVKQFSSCTLIESGDSLKSINAAASAIVNYASNKAGIGVSIGRIRAVDQPVRGGDAVTTGVIPFAKYLSAALKSCSQGAVRGASGTFNYPLWHLEFGSLIELKNNKGTEETRLRNVDYCVHLHKVFYERLIAKSHITFFSPEEVPELYEAFYGKEANRFRELYEACEANDKLTKIVLPAMEVFAKLVTERFETGRIYIMHADLVNYQTSILEPIKMTNLCVEVTQHTEEMGTPDEMIALCTLAAVNMGKADFLEKLPRTCELLIRGLDELLDYQDYPHPAAERHTQQFRPVGVGVIGFAHFLARRGLRWGSDEALKATNQAMAHISYHLINASCKLAEEKGACPRETNYHRGIFPWELSNYRQDLGVCNGELDWEELRGRLKKFGIRNATVMSLMPSETSSQLANETNGIEPPKELISFKGDKKVISAQVVPEYARLNHVYETVWDVTVPDYLSTLGVMQRFIDQSISANTTFSSLRDKTDTETMIRTLLHAYKSGLKTLYYSTILRKGDDNDEDGGGNSEESGECDSGACKI